MAAFEPPAVYADRSRDAAPTLRPIGHIYTKHTLCWPGSPPLRGLRNLSVHDGCLAHRDAALLGVRFAPEGAVWSDEGIMSAPSLDEGPGLSQGIEDLTVQHFISQSWVRPSTKSYNLLAWQEFT